MTSIDSQAHDVNHLKSINNIAFKRMDTAGNKDCKVSVKEAYEDLNVNFMSEGQSATDTFKATFNTPDIPEVLKKYAGKDGEFSAKEWANFLNGDEWGEALEAWHSSEKMAELEKDWAEAENLYYRETEDTTLQKMNNKWDKDDQIAIEEALANIDITSIFEEQSTIDTLKMLCSNG